MCNFLMNYHYFAIINVNALFSHSFCDTGAMALDSEGVSYAFR